jgi:TPR repeat protein
MYLAGESYSDGYGVSKDQDKANAWNKRAAEAGHADAQYKYARIFGSTGRATLIIAKADEKQDYARQYLEWLDKAAKESLNK